MRLVRLEVRNFRSIQDQTGAQSIELRGPDCMIGPNNAGKSNLLKCVKYLVRGERADESDHYARDLDYEIDVRGYFEVEEVDFERLKLGEKREPFQAHILEDGTLGICNRSTTNDLELLRQFPIEKRLHPDQYIAARDKAWDEKKSKNDFRDTMQGKFPELVPFLTDGKEGNKGEWQYAYDQMLQQRPETIKFELRPGSPPQGISADLKNFLPEVLVVPAVKEVGEATKTTRTAELGSLLNAVSQEIQEELDEAIDKALAQVSRQLNVVVDEASDEVIDERHDLVRLLEGRISEYVAETFPTHSISLQFPNPESTVMFSNARVWVEEKDHEKVLAEDVGEGVKRILIFSLIRTLADLRQGRLGVREKEESDVEEPAKPILLLYEEAELFLHPGLQKILLGTFEDLTGSGDQVIYSTHSPFMIPDISVAAVTLVRKRPNKGTQTKEIVSNFLDREPKHRRRLKEIQNISSYIFSDRVLLVEGPSDKIVIRKISKVLNPAWDFQREGIPILPVIGKGNLPIFRSFLKEIGIHPFVIADLDAVEYVLGTFALPEHCKDNRRHFLSIVDEVAEEYEEETRVNRPLIHNHIATLNWEGVIEQLEELFEQLYQDLDVEPEGIAALRRILDIRRETAKTLALRSKEERVRGPRSALRASLLEQDILLLSGELEDYYPYEDGNKLEAALEFDVAEMDPADLRDRMAIFPEYEVGDLEALLQRVFE